MIKPFPISQQHVRFKASVVLLQPSLESRGCNLSRYLVHKAYLVYVFEELLLLLVIQGVGMRHVAQCILRLQGRKHNLIFCLQNSIVRIYQDET